MDQLLEEAKDRWGEIPEAGGSEEEEEDPPDVLEFWHEQGEALLKSPTFAPTTPSALGDSDHDSDTTQSRGRLAPFPHLGDVEETNSGDKPAHADLEEKASSRSVPMIPRLGGTGPGYTRVAVGKGTTALTSATSTSTTEVATAETTATTTDGLRSSCVRGTQ